MTNNDEFDLTKFTAELVQQNFKELVAFTGKLTGAVRSQLVRSLPSTYSKYIVTAAEHYGTARTFFIRDVRQPLYNYYVPLEIGLGKRNLKDAAVNRIRGAGNHAIIAGKAGCGKSTLMRHLFLDCIRDGKLIPVFIELNQLNNHEDVDLWGLIVRSVQKHGLKMDQTQIRLAIESGGFALLFDGLDEVEDTLRRETLNQIGVVAATTSNNMVIVSTRPDDDCAVLKSFHLYQVLPLSLDKAVALVEKLPFDELIRSKFVEDLKKSLFEKHQTFLSNPLLLSIMLLTYGQSASIPSKISVFYNQAYEALFQTHDAYKGGFSRKRSTTLDIQDFERAFAAFCLVSYDSSAFTFSKTECLDLMSKAKAVSRVDFSPSAFLKDCLQSINLLMEDGLKIAFVHRSFQEYFAAKCITRLDVSMKPKMLARFGGRSRTESVIDRYWELDAVSCEDLWLLPTLTDLREKIGVKRSATMTCYLKYLKLLYDSLSLRQQNGKTATWIRLSYSPGQKNSDQFRQAVWLAYFRYWRPQRKSIPQTPKDGSEEKVEDREIKISDLTIRSQELRELSKVEGVTSQDFLNFLVNLPTSIREKRMTEVESIENILGLGKSS
jgi:hypothetical protein